MSTVPTRREEWTPHPDALASRILQALDHTDARCIPTFPDALPNARYAATHRLQAAGYLTRQAQPGDAPSRWVLTDAGERARQRITTGQTRRQARLLVLLSVTPLSVQALHHAYVAAYGDHTRQYLYGTLADLHHLELVKRDASVATWTLTAAGHDRR